VYRFIRTGGMGILRAMNKPKSEYAHQAMTHGD
jgi:hypothetical protein